MTYTHYLGSHFRMSEQSDRLQLALKEAGLTMKEATARWGWSYNTLKSNANGNMPYGFQKAQVYAARLNVRAEWLYAGTPPMREPPRAARRPTIEVPVLSWVSAGRIADVGHIEELQDVERIIIAGLPTGQWFATDVVGDSMDRVSPEGSRIIVNAAEKRPVPGGFYIFSLRGEATYKRYYAKPNRLEPYSTNPANRAIFLEEGPDWTVIGRVHRSVLDL
jgi:SOS-response transcriptional repressor LexA